MMMTMMMTMMMMMMMISPAAAHVAHGAAGVVAARAPVLRLGRLSCLAARLGRPPLSSLRPAVTLAL